uniref:conserved hypothetical chloroplast protein Ycf1 n=1 Tax=Schizaea pusilla TaxID=148579 RepID=UPI00211DD8E5|nr:conserved hypothetical chloroplast protein Ycf1 [Schizaea pusilla]YP_010451557.1 conserved hypothetical chloroplast protein Ycf1 [Schizaea pusilla]UTV01470.1 conserved hypothetical chloroplast protein Ycf1 [Schizaea pusilla]UTV01471.1 conserved hypothetical chloroplast protein Ycf1 [Schizaea pusilla]
MSPSLLFGFYYGLLPTLPIGPSQILCLRSFLLWGDFSGIAALIGSMTGQLLVFSSVFFSPIYLLIPRPNLVTIAVLPYVFLFWSRTKDLPDYQALRPAQSIRDSRVASTFPNSPVLQPFNPILLPNATLARLIHLVVFRYSNSTTFLMGSFSGWLIGHLLLGQSSRLSMHRIEKDSPILYILLKRVMHKTFSIVSFITMLLYPGRSPVPFMTRKFEDELIKYDKTCLDSPSSAKWLCESRPTSLFDPRRTNRPMRHRPISRISHQSDIKRRVSTCFFTECVTDSKSRLVFASSPGSSILEEQLKNSLKGFDVSLSTPSLYRNWILDHLNERDNLHNELKDRIRLLNNGCVFSGAIEKRTRSKIEGVMGLPKISDPLMSQLHRVRVPNSRSFLAICETAMPVLKTSEDFAEVVSRENKIETWILNKHKEFLNNKIPLPWEPLSPDALEVSEFVFDRFIPNEQKLESLELRNVLEAIKSFQPSVTWEDISKLLPTDRALSFIYFEDMCRNPSRAFLYDASSTDQKEFSFMMGHRGNICLTHRIEDLERDLFRNTQFINESRFDIAGMDSDIRNKKLRNLAISFGKTGLRSAKPLKRYSKSSDFRRRLIKGSMRARRRKTLISRMLQGKTHSPFFIRWMEIPVSASSWSKGSAKWDPEVAVVDTRGGASPQVEQASITPSPQNSFGRSKYERLNLAARLDMGSIHTGRGLLLVSQSNFRRYLKLPLLIIPKNIGRILCLQVPEWGEDWIDPCRESHVIRSYDGEEFPENRFPGRWSKDGVQTKILFPSQLKPWHSKKRGSFKKKGITNQSIKPEVSSNDNDVDQLGRERVQFSHLTAWGFQTDVPFGTTRKDPSFWNPVRQRIVKTFRKRYALRTKQVGRFINRLIESMRFGRAVPNPFIGVEGIERTAGMSNAEGQGPTDVGSRIKKSEKLAGHDAINGEAELKSNTINSNTHSVSDYGETLVRYTTNKSKSDTRSGMMSLFGDAVSGGPGENDRRALRKRIEEMDIQELRDTSIGRSFRSDIESIAIRQKLFELHTWVAKPKNNCVSSSIKLYQTILKITAYPGIGFEALGARLVRTVSGIAQIHEKKEQSDLDVHKQRAALLGIGSNGSTGFLSQAYVFDGVWSTSLKDGMDLTVLLENEVSDKGFGRSANNLSSYEAKYFGDVPTRDLHKYPYIDESITKYGRYWGFLKSIHALNANDWKIRLDCLDRYNLPIETWSQISPKKWRNFLDKKKKFEWVDAGVHGENHYLLKRRAENHSIHAENSLLRDRIANLGKKRGCSNLLHSFAYFLRDTDVLGFTTRQNSIERRIRSGNRMSQIAKERRKGLSVRPVIPNSIMKWDVKLDSAPWMIAPDLVETYKNNTISRPKKSVPIETYEVLLGKRSHEEFDVGLPFNKFSSEKSEVRKPRFATRHSFRPKRRWKFRSKLLEQKSEKLRELASTIHVMGNYETILAFTEDMDLEPDLLSMILDRGRRKVLNHLFFNAYPRRTKVLTDQILMYKMISTLSKFRNKFRKVSNKKGFDEFLLCLPKKQRGRERVHSIFYNIEDLLSPRCRRQLRFLESLSIPSHTDFSDSVLDFVPGEGAEMNGYESPIKVQRIKRLLWPTHRLEELACVNRFCFGATDGSRSAILRMKMYPDT